MYLPHSWAENLRFVVTIPARNSSSRSRLQTSNSKRDHADKAQRTEHTIEGDRMSVVTSELALNWHGRSAGCPLRARTGPSSKFAHAACKARMLHRRCSQLDAVRPGVNMREGNLLPGERDRISESWAATSAPAPLLAWRLFMMITLSLFSAAETAARSGKCVRTSIR
jgi:hypothetical protein